MRATGRVGTKLSSGDPFVINGDKGTTRELISIARELRNLTSLQLALKRKIGAESHYSTSFSVSSVDEFIHKNTFTHPVAVNCHVPNLGGTGIGTFFQVSTTSGGITGRVHGHGQATDLELILYPGEELWFTNTDGNIQLYVSVASPVLGWSE